MVTKRFSNGQVFAVRQPQVEVFRPKTERDVGPGTIDDAIAMHDKGELPSPRDWNPAISPEIERIMRVMLERDPTRRYQRARDIVRELELLLYQNGYGPTNERLAEYLDAVFPEVDKHRLLPEEMIMPR